MPEHPVGPDFDDRYLQHDTGRWIHGTEEREPFPFADPVPHPSSPALVGRAKHLIALSGIADLMERVKPSVASDDTLLARHPRGYLDQGAELSADKGGDSGEGAPIGRGGDRVARLAADGAMPAVDAVVSGASMPWSAHRATSDGRSRDGVQRLQQRARHRPPRAEPP
ncbi:MAG: hypothetical protein AVDCRST_MAG59-4292 [uncultured Thermomicrobiales bacterium]|uniref:Uncharacterized protein n=1 Tax=uncultured Thermomicrobiales bacterium TaxID=1645740 RepID=A0A6J4VFZ4_9BACT|nr:MAG: hypothetical protein AVDCRST_MAG59-4292 [uncultured Thermomicrobiales bacterium]